MARAPKDGYTLLLGSSANITNQAITANPTTDMIRDFAPIALFFSEAPVILVVHPATGVKSAPAGADRARQGEAGPPLLDALAARARPPPHCSAELFDVRAPG